MTLATGARLGAYDIGALIGVGGMGEVYRARDTRLDRDVALKVLPDAFALDPERLARFQREARVLASLNHPNIAAIYGLEEADGVKALVLELVEGPTLADRIAQGPIPIDEALPIAKQIAEALETAHELGIIHRDLKPANVKVREDGTVKVLDFGLAKALAPESGTAAAANLTQSPTITSPAAMTGVGVSLGTAAYMSPEQAKGRPADKRSDVWAFGCLLYEMLTGQRAFDGEDMTDVLGAVVRLEPKWTALPSDVPPPVRTLVEGCLVKDRRRRVADISTALFVLGKTSSLSIADHGSISQDPAYILKETAARETQAALAGTRGGLARLWRRRVVLVSAVASILVGGVVAGGMWLAGRAPSSQAELPTVRFQLFAPPEATLPSQAAAAPKVSPDGRRIVFPVRHENTVQLAVRALDSLETEILAGTERASRPFWSPDSRSIAFFAQGQLKRIAASGGPVQTLCDAPAGREGTWNREGVILFSPDQLEGLYQVPADGGMPTPVTTIDKANGEQEHFFANFLSDGRHFLYTATGVDVENSWVRLGQLGSTESRALVKTNSNAVYVRTDTRDYILFAREGILLAQAFDIDTLSMVGEATPVTEKRTYFDAGGFTAFSVSDTGTLAYRDDPVSTGRQLAWLDRTGRVLDAVGAPGWYNHIELSPDSKRAAVDRWDNPASPQSSQIWLLDLASGTPSQFTFTAGRFVFPRWAADGSRLAFAAQGDHPGLALKAASGAGVETQVYDSTDGNAFAGDWSPDGQSIVFRRIPPGTQGELWLLSMSGRREAKAVPQTDVRGTNGRFSPDGRWLAYQSSDSGRAEVYVQPLPPTGAKWLISRNGGVRPRWRRDGRELFYVTAEGTLTAVPITAGDTIQAGEPSALFDLEFLPGGVNAYQYAASADGQRFLVITPQETASSAAISVVLNWQEELKRLVPTK